MEPIDLNNEDTLDTIIGDLGSDIADAVRNVANGTVSDLEGFGQGIARNLLEIAQIPDEDRREALKQELGAQARLLAEKQRLSVAAEGWKVFDRNIEIASNVAFTFLRAAAAGI